LETLIFPRQETDHEEYSTDAKEGWSMTDWSLRDTLGIVIIIGITISAARAVDGIAQALLVLVGVVIALLWIGNFVLRGYTDALQTSTTD
jgi:hypothetical protein